MSVVLSLHLQDDRLPTLEQWQQALRRASVDIVLDDVGDLRGHAGFLPAAYRGQLSGFEWYYDAEDSGDAPAPTLLSPVAGLWPQRRSVPAKPEPSSKCVASFRIGADFKELACAMSAAAVLAELTGGALVDEDDTPFGLDQARDVEADAFGISSEAEVFRHDGIAVITGIVTDTADLQQLRELPEFQHGPGHRGGQLPTAAVAQLMADEGVLTKLASKLMRRPARPVRVLYFDKTEAANWAVSWHQDRTIAVAERVAVPDYDVWSVKDGVVHVEPSVDVLRGMVSIRLHVDDCGMDNGPLQAARRSFEGGRIPSAEIASRVAAGDVRTYPCRAGDVVAMRGLTIHASARATRPEHRRVLHVDFATVDLPPPLAWAM